MKYMVQLGQNKQESGFNMKKIEFSYINGHFVIESDDDDSREFVEKYTDLFLEKLSNCKFLGKTTAIQDNVAQVEAPSSMEINTSSESLNNVDSEEVIDLFGVSKKQLAYLIDFNNDNIKIIVRNKIIKGTKAEMQVKLSLLYCGACEYKGTKANTKDIRNICNLYQCLDGNFAQNIKREKYFNISGAVNADICLTMPGKDKLLDVVNEILSAMEMI